MIKIKDPMLSPALEVKEALIDGDGSMCIYAKDKFNPLVHNDAFFWMIETWIKNNDIAYKVDRNQKPYSSDTGIRIFGKELSDIDFFINNL